MSQSLQKFFWVYCPRHAEYAEFRILRFVGLLSFFFFSYFLVFSHFFLFIFNFLIFYWGSWGGLWGGDEGWRLGRIIGGGGGLWGGGGYRGGGDYGGGEDYGGGGGEGWRLWRIVLWLADYGTMVGGLWDYGWRTMGGAAMVRGLWVQRGV